MSSVMKAELGQGGKRVDLDSILVEEVGQFGRYQLFTLAMFPVIFSAEYMFTTVLKVWAPLPPVLFSSLALLSGLLLLTTPETLGTKLPGTMEEAEQMNSRKSPQHFENNSMKKEPLGIVLKRLAAYLLWIIQAGWLAPYSIPNRIHM